MKPIKTAIIFLIIVFVGIVILFFLDKLNKINLPIIDKFVETSKDDQ